MNREIITIENGTVSVPASTEIWMSQHQLADLFQCFVGKINANIRAILKNGVLDESKVCRTYRYKNGNFVEQYNLEMIIALSFRIQSRNAEAFRKYLVQKSLKTEQTTRLILPLHIMDINYLN
ncbi:protein-tyrosine kinase [Dysgonomonas sp. 511]|uniref:protein-tyrosine kinase n=1 Tax=Dysgonomonas sp. 511 TaxID=2302930 RepID=UPI0013D827F8|nr:protein-tyrosine kinase [Dysgonomonas sp. 511]NDV79951.1 protein-tyrosine kinase [Dysgonomonas sp. 511]